MFPVLIPSWWDTMVEETTDWQPYFNTVHALCCLPIEAYYSMSTNSCCHFDFQLASNAEATCSQHVFILLWHENLHLHDTFFQFTYWLETKRCTCLQCTCCTTLSLWTMQRPMWTPNTVVPQVLLLFCHIVHSFALYKWNSFLQPLGICLTETYSVRGLPVPDQVVSVFNCFLS